MKYVDMDTLQAEVNSFVDSHLEKGGALTDSEFINTLRKYETRLFSEFQITYFD